MKKTRKLLAYIPALALSAALAFGAGAQGVVGDVIDGAENIVDDTVDTAEDILGGSDETIGTSDTVTDSTADDDIPDQLEDDALTDESAGKDESDVSGAGDTSEDPNPNTGIGIPFMTAGLVAVSAAGVAYLTRKREGFTKK